MGVDGATRLPAGPVLAGHVAVVGRGRAPGQTIPLVVGSHAVKTVAARQPAFEVVDVRELDVGPRTLVVVAVLVEPGNGIWTAPAVGWGVVRWDRRRTGVRGLRPD